MKSYGNKYYFKKKFLKKIKKSSKNISSFNLKLTHNIIDTINYSLLSLIFILFFLSFNSQRKWTNQFEILSKAKTINNNLIDYISKTEEFYISEIESLNTLKKTTPGDLIYLNKIIEKREDFFYKKIVHIINGFKDSRYQRGY